MNENKSLENSISNFDVILSGIVLSKDSVGQAYGKILIKKSYSNYSNYDPRDTLRNFICVIRENQAEIIMGHINEVQLNDSVSIDGKNNSFRIYRKFELIKSFEIREIIVRSGITRQIAEDKFVL